MKFAPAPSLKPLNLARTPRVAPRPLKGSDLSSAARLTKPAQTQHDRVVAQTQKWVAQTFFGTLMKQMRDSPFRSDLFEGGRGGQAFASMYDQKLVEQMSRGAGNKLVNAIVHSIEKNMRKAQAGAAYDKQKGAAAGSDKPREVDAVSHGVALPADARQLDRAVGEARRSSFNHVRADVPAAFRS